MVDGCDAVDTQTDAEEDQGGLDGGRIGIGGVGTCDAEETVFKDFAR